VEAAGHYHRPLLGSGGVAGWEVVELSPARVSEQRRVQGRRRVKTDAIDLEAIIELVLAGHGIPMMARAAAVTELRGGRCTVAAGSWHGLRRRNQFLAQLDRCFAGLTMLIAHS
jgi:transposase